ncbi:hypothetical protein H0X06_02615 [Candidatus Dependentiae bacterium]|nr:hypothetical protein [Candidatus Dependentiae bacterium]
MKFKLYSMTLCLVACSSLVSMEHVVPQDPGINPSLVGSMFSMFMSKPAQNEQSLFPLQDIDAESFDDIFTYAYQGKIDTIKNFCIHYDKYKNYQNERKETFTAFAGYGYINGEDSWKTFAYLLDENVPLSDSFKVWLDLSDSKDVTKDYKKKQLSKVIKEKESYVETLEDPFYSTPLTPPDILIIPEEPSFISSVPRIIGLGAVAFIGAYIYQSRQLKKAATVQPIQNIQLQQKK